MSQNKYFHSGFTLVELIIVIVITGILAGMVSIFIKTPIEQYIDIARRAEMTDIADTALRRMGRDIRTAVPNSVRLSSDKYIEFLPTKAGGRYRANSDGTDTLCTDANNKEGDSLSFAEADSCFEIIGSAIDFSLSDYIVMGSTQSDAAPPYDKTAAGVLRDYKGVAGVQSTVLITPTLFPAFASLESQRFQVISGIDQAVTYACENIGTVNGNGVGTLKRYSGYDFNPAQIAPPVGGLNALLADKISACSITYDNSNIRNGLVTISLTIAHGGESISLYHEIHVNNLP
jgi:MSHA biogenesis protein MshO